VTLDRCREFHPLAHIGGWDSFFGKQNDVVKADTNNPEYGGVFRHIPCGHLVRVKRRIDSSEPPTIEIVFADGTVGIVPRCYLDLHFTDKELAEFERACVWGDRVSE